MKTVLTVVEDSAEPTIRVTLEIVEGPQLALSPDIAGDVTFSYVEARLSILASELRQELFPPRK